MVHRKLLFSALFFLLSSSVQRAQTSVKLEPSPCTSSNASLLGFVKLPPHADYPGNDLDYLPSVATRDCLAACLGYPGNECVMVTTSPAGECWLKSQVGPVTAVNSHVVAYAMPCSVNSTCGDRLCGQTVGPTAVTCQCLPAQAVAYEPASPFNAWYQGYDATWQGTSLQPDSQQCVEACSGLTAPCALALYNPGTRQCFIKYQFEPSSAKLDPAFQAFVNICSNRNGHCAMGWACLNGPPQRCINAADLGFGPLDPDLDYQGTDIISFTKMDPASCLRVCKQTENCSIAQAQPESLHCGLKSAPGVPIAAAGYLAFRLLPP